jgi:hypothetical protein
MLRDLNDEKQFVFLHLERFYLIFGAIDYHSLACKIYQVPIEGTQIKSMSCDFILPTDKQ